MKSIPWKGIALVCLAIVVLIVARCAVTVGKAFYYGQDWLAELVEDPWFLIGILVTAIGLGALAGMAVQNKKSGED